MVFRCCVGKCANKASKGSRITLFQISYENDERTTAKQRRQAWVDFVAASKGMSVWVPTKSSRICCQHFQISDFVRRYEVLGTGTFIKKLKVDELGILAIPTIFADPSSFKTTSSMSPQSRRKSVQEIIEQQSPLETPETCDAEISLDMYESAARSSSVVESPCTTTVLTRDSFVQTEACIEKCASCTELIAKNRELNNRVIDLEANSKQLQHAVQTLERELKWQSESQKPTDQHHGPVDDDDDEDDDNSSMEDMNDSRDFLDVSIEVEPGAESGSEYFPTPKKPKQAGSEEVESESEEEENEKQSNWSSTSGNLRTEPKYIVFISQLLLLFNFCPTCKSDNPLIETEATGTMVTVTTSCSNPKCPKREHRWSSQPMLPGTKMPAGNFLLLFAILVAGGSASKVLQIFSNMGLCCFTLKTFFVHQQRKLFPAIYLRWKTYQTDLLGKLLDKKKPLVIGGDARHDSMGHSAKYGIYTMFCCCTPAIIHFALVQRNEVGNSTGMEYHGFQQCMQFLLGVGMSIGVLITDRHTSIAKHMRERLPNIKHYFDLWHIQKKIGKVLTKISKLSGCESLKPWIHPCQNHFYWSVTSTITGGGKLMWAKFKSFLSHIIDKHERLDDPMFNKCHHGEIEPRQWLLRGIFWLPFTLIPI